MGQNSLSVEFNWNSSVKTFNWNSSVKTHQANTLLHVRKLVFFLKKLLFGHCLPHHRVPEYLVLLNGQVTRRRYISNLRIATVTAAVAKRSFSHAIPHEGTRYLKFKCQLGNIIIKINIIVILLLSCCC